MPKHIHVHIHRALDSAESKHDPSNGQFTSGAAGGNAMHHHKQAQFHMGEKNHKGSSHPDTPHHSLAMAAHGQARNALEYAKGASGSEARSNHMTAAQTHANNAAGHESKIGGEAKAPRELKPWPKGKKETPGFGKLGAGAGAGAGKASASAFMAGRKKD